MSDKTATEIVVTELREVEVSVKLIEVQVNGVRRWLVAYSAVVDNVTHRAVVKRQFLGGDGEHDPARARRPVPRAERLLLSARRQ